MIQEKSYKLENNRLKGSMVALVTPFKKNLQVDFESLIDLVKFQVEGNTQAIVLCGTTGESATLTSEEKIDILKAVIEFKKQNNLQIPIIFGSGTNNTQQTIELSKKAEELGSDYIMLITPYYNKPTQKGILNHFTQIASSTQLPIILYNVPGRTVTEISIPTLLDLCKVSSIVAIKDAISDLRRPIEINRKIVEMFPQKNFAQIGGEDATVLAYLASGGSGCISVTANVAPSHCQNVHSLWQNSNFVEALSLQTKLLPLHDSMFCEASPSPAKYALSLLGKCNEYVRSPICELEEESKQNIQKILKNLELI